jgi:hypothetical protein
MGADTKDAQANAYALLKEINWPSAYLSVFEKPIVNYF